MPLINLLIQCSWSCYDNIEVNIGSKETYNPLATHF